MPSNKPNLLMMIHQKVLIPSGMPFGQAERQRQLPSQISPQSTRDKLIVQSQPSEGAVLTGEQRMKLIND